MSLMKLFPMLLNTKPADTLRESINSRIINCLEKDRIPWQKPWRGYGKGVGFPRNFFNKKKYFGINVVLLQMAASENQFTSNWWGTSEQFAKFGGNVHRPSNVVPGYWGTGIALYKVDVSSNKTLCDSAVVYNYDQSNLKLEAYQPEPILIPDYSLAEKVLHSTIAKIKHNNKGEAWYFYPPDDYISLPKKAYFEAGIGGLPGYYESLAHELIHWSEARLRFEAPEAICELRAEIGASLLMEELGVPPSISYSNINKWKASWVKMMRRDYDLIFKISASACNAVDYIISFSMKVEERFNQISENVA